MGWDSCDSWTKKGFVVADRLRDYLADSTFEVLDHKTTKSGLWVVVKNRNTGLKGIFFDLIQKHGKTYSVKSMDESMGPFYYDCPKKFLQMVPPVASESFMYNLSWRAKVRKQQPMYLDEMTEEEKRDFFASVNGEPVKDPYKKLSHEWGSKRRKADSRQAKSTLKKPTKEELAEVRRNKILDYAVQQTQFRAENPPSRCDRCGDKIDDECRQWDGTSWHCDLCAEETQQ